MLHPRHLLNIYIINMWRQVLQVEVNDFVFVPALVEVHLGALTGAMDIAAQVPLLVCHRISALQLQGLLLWCLKALDLLICAFELVIVQS